MWARRERNQGYAGQEGKGGAKCARRERKEVLSVLGGKERRCYVGQEGKKGDAKCARRERKEMLCVLGGKERRC